VGNPRRRVRAQSTGPRHVRMWHRSDAELSPGGNPFTSRSRAGSFARDGRPRPYRTTGGEGSCIRQPGAGGSGSHCSRARRSSWLSAWRQAARPRGQPPDRSLPAARPPSSASVSPDTSSTLATRKGGTPATPSSRHTRHRPSTASRSPARTSGPSSRLRITSRCRSATTRSTSRGWTPRPARCSMCSS
jgi:hypothetical protein